MISGGLSKYKNKNVLLLQGPLGPFFHLFAKDLRAAGATVFKINFNLGDWLYYMTKSVLYRGRMEDWPEYFIKFVETHQIDSVFLFGDCRQIHRAAHEIATSKGLDIGVFEEGYVRPNHITLERSGTNAYSKLPKNPEYYINQTSHGDC